MTEIYLVFQGLFSMVVDRPLHIRIAGRMAVLSEENCSKGLPNSVYS